MPFIPLHDDNPRILIAQPWVTWGLMLVSILVFLGQVLAGPMVSQRLILGLGLIPATLTGQAELPPEFTLVPPAATPFTSLFLHGSALHLIGNMLYLWVFGDNVEDAMGHRRFLVFYLLCGLVAGLATVMSSPGATVPTIGASGAISAILGAYLVLHPRARVLVPVILFIPFYIPAFVLLILWIGVQVFSAATTGPFGGGVAWWAHIGGFFAGAILVVPFRYKTVPLFGGDDLPSGLRLTRGWRRRRPSADDGRGPWDKP